MSLRNYLIFLSGLNNQFDKETGTLQGSWDIKPWREDNHFSSFVGDFFLRTEAFPIWVVFLSNVKRVLFSGKFLLLVNQAAVQTVGGSHRMHHRLLTGLG